MQPSPAQKHGRRWKKLKEISCGKVAKMTRGPFYQTKLCSLSLQQLTEEKADGLVNEAARYVCCNLSVEMY